MVTTCVLHHLEQLHLDILDSNAVDVSHPVGTHRSNGLPHRRMKRVLSHLSHNVRRRQISRQWYPNRSKQVILQRRPS